MSEMRDQMMGDETKGSTTHHTKAKSHFFGHNFKKVFVTSYP